MPRSYRDIISDRSKAHTAREDWFNCVEGIVAERDATTMAVKVVIPSIDESFVHDEWVDALVPWVGPDGYGPAHLPALGSEVILFSRMNEGATLFYLPRYNEEYRPPAEFADGSRGCKCDSVYRLLCNLLIQIISQTRVQVRGESRVDVESAGAVDVDAPDVRLKGGGAVGVHARGAEVGFMGAPPVARQQLPGPAVDEASDRALTNALRVALIALGLCE